MHCRIIVSHINDNINGCINDLVLVLMWRTAYSLTKLLSGIVTNNYRYINNLFTIVWFKMCLATSVNGQNKHSFLFAMYNLTVGSIL